MPVYAVTAEEQIPCITPAYDNLSQADKDRVDDALKDKMEDEFSDNNFSTNGPWTRTAPDHNDAIDQVAQELQGDINTAFGFTGSDEVSISVPPASSSVWTDLGNGHSGVVPVTNGNSSTGNKWIMTVTVDGSDYDGHVKFGFRSEESS